MIYDLDSCDAACHPHAQRAASAVVVSLEFITLYDHADTTATGRARMLDGSTSRGPFSFWRRVPVEAPQWATHRSLFCLSRPEAFSVALAVDLLVLPPIEGEANEPITACSCSPERAILPGDRHFVNCPYGVRLNGTCHDPAKWALVAICDAIVGTSRVIAERHGPHGQGALSQFMAAEGNALRHRPDLVLLNYDGPGKHVVVDVKTFDAAGASQIAQHHTDKRRLAAHEAASRDSIRDEYGAMPRGFRLVIFAVSTLGSFGPAAQTLLAELGRRTGGGVPVMLLDEATWAVPRLAPFARMAIGCAVRRGLAESVLERWRRQTRTLTPPPLPPPGPLPPPLQLPLHPPPPPLGPQPADALAQQLWPQLLHAPQPIAAHG